MKRMRKFLSMVLAGLMLLAVLPMQNVVMAAETLVYNENFNGYDTVSELGGNWNVVGEGYTSIEEGKGGGKSLYAAYQAVYTLDEMITSGKIIVSYSIKPGADITTVVRVKDESTSYILNCIKDTGEFLEGTSSDNANAYKMGTHELGKWYDFVTTIDLDEQTVTSTLTDENGESVTTPANTIKWGTTGAVEINGINSFTFQIWPKSGEQNNKELGSYFDNFKIVKVADDAPVFEHKETVEVKEKKFDFETPISTGKYKLLYDFYPTSKMFLHLTRDTNSSYVMNYYDNKLYYGAYNGDVSAVMSASINASNLHHAEITFDMDTGASTCVVTDTVTGAEYTKTRNLSWCVGSGGSASWETQKANITALRVTSWDATPNVSNIRLEKYYEGVTITQDDITIKDSAGNIQVLDDVSLTSNTITIEFDKAMKEETLTVDNIYVKNTADSKKVNYTGSYADGIYTMTLGEMLKAEAEYEIVISKDVETLEGGKNAVDTLIIFNTQEPLLVGDEPFSVEENFDELTTLGSQWSKNAGTELVDDENGGKMLKQGLTADVDNYLTELALPVAITSGKYELSFSFKPGKDITTNITVRNTKKNQSYCLTSFQNGMILNGSNSDTNYKIADGLAAEKWYDVKFAFDFDKGSSEITVTDEEGNTYTKSRAVSLIAATGTKISDIKHILIQVWSKKDSASYIDNIVFKQILDAPLVTADSITLSTVEGTMVENFTAVSPLTNKVMIDFGTMMGTETLTTENIKLTNKKTGADLAYTLTYIDGVLTLNLPGILEANSTYILKVSKDVENALGVVMGDDVEIEFTTSEGVTKATLKKVTVNSNEITALNQLQKGDNMAICFDYANSTNEAKTLHVIAAYFYDNRLVSVDYITDEISEDVVCTTHKVNHTVLDTSLIDEIKIMAWDGFDTMKPLSRSLSIK